MRSLLIITLLMLFWASLVEAQDYSSDSDNDAIIENSFGIGPRLGFYKAENADEGNFYGGLQLRARLGAVVGLEGAVEYRAGQESNFNVGNGGQSVQTKFVPVTASLLLFIPTGAHISPYGIAGLGAYYTIYDYDGDFENENDNEFNLGYHLGFGLEFPISSGAALNIDYRYLFLNPDEGDADFQNADYNGNVFSAGLMFYF